MQDPSERHRLFSECNKCEIPSLFVQFPENLKQDPSVCHRFLEKCDSDAIPELFKQFPESLKQDPSVRHRFFEKCSQLEIPSLFVQFPENLKQDPSVCHRFLEKCDSYAIPSLFEKIPESLKQDPSVCHRFLEECSRLAIPSLFEKFPESLKQDPSECHRFLEECHPEATPDLFVQFPESLKQDPSVCHRFLEQCNLYAIPELFKQFPESLKQDPSVCHRSFEKCAPQAISHLFGHFPESLKQDASVCHRFLEKCYLFSIPQLFVQFPENLKQDASVCHRCFEKCDPSFVSDLTRHFPESIQQEINASRHSLLASSARLLGAALTFGGALEGAVAAAAHSLGPIKEHWKKSKQYMPLPFCNMSPPQPLFLVAILDVAKIFCLSFMLGFIDRDLSKKADELAQWHKRAAYTLNVVIQLGIVPFTTASYVIHFFRTIYPDMPDARTGGECFFLGWNGSFFDFSYMLLFLRFVGNRFIVSNSLRNSDEDDGRQKRTSIILSRRIAEELFLAPRANLVDMTETLLNKKSSLGEFLLTRASATREEKAPMAGSIGLLEFKKVVLLQNACVITASIYVTVNVPFIIFYKIPAIFIFSPFLLLVLVLSWAAWRFTWPEYIAANIQGRSLEQLINWHQAERTGYIVFVPILLGLSVCNLILTYGPVYFYRGEGWISSAMAVFTDRHFDRYLKGFKDQVLGETAPASAFVEEVL